MWKAGSGSALTWRVGSEALKWKAGSGSALKWKAASGSKLDTDPHKSDADHLITYPQGHYLQSSFQSAQHLYEKREGLGSGSIPLTDRSGSGSPKNMRFLWIRILNTGTKVFKEIGTGTLVLPSLLLTAPTIVTEINLGQRDTGYGSGYFCVALTCLPLARMLRMVASLTSSYRRM